MDDEDIDPYKILELDSTFEDLADADVLKVSSHASLIEHACVLAVGNVPSWMCQIRVCPTRI